MCRNTLVFATIVAGALPGTAAVVRFTATINAAQETTASTSTATGSAVLLFDVATNKLDLTITLEGFANTLSNSHIHEGAVGVSGAPVTTLGDETVYTRTGNTLTASFANLTYGGDAATLIRGDAYLNFHSGAFTAGEIRGQLVPDPVRLAAHMTGAQEVPARTTNAFGAAQVIYTPTTNKVTILAGIYNFTNTLTNSHLHEAPAGVNGDVRTSLGGAASYERSGNAYLQIFTDRDWTGSALTLLNDGAYYNVHSNVFGGGEIRGQLMQVDASAPGRLVNVSARGNVGTSFGVLITGFVVEGANPLRLLVTARGPGLAAFGLPDVLTDPVLTIYNAAGVEVISNDDAGSAPLAALISGSSFAPVDTAESAALVVLPPGVYTSVVSSADAVAGVGLAEAFEIAW